MGKNNIEIAFAKCLDEYPDDYRFTKKEVIGFAIAIMEGCGEGLLKVLKDKETNRS